MSSVVVVIFFLSGVAGLVYEVAWVRSLTLVFGGSHLAVTTVLAVFMGGLALGSKLLGARADRTRRALRMYGALEVGVALSALLCLELTRIYPAIYGPLARLAEDDRVWLSILRVTFAIAAMILPTTLMGGTLPVLTRFVGRHPRKLGNRLSVLYGVNTLGAAAGALAAGFLLLRSLGVTRTILAAVATNFVIGTLAMILPERLFGVSPADGSSAVADGPAELVHGDRSSGETYRLALWGAAISGFCALGYEVLWTRMLTLVVGTSVYSFTIILVAFLTGIALGSGALALVQARRRITAGRAASAFAVVQGCIGVSALTVTVLMRDLPSHALALQRVALGSAGTEFGARQGANFAIAFTFLLVPAFLMGVAFPLAGVIHAACSRSIGGAIGEVLTYNTIGSILGSAVSGFVLVYAFGIERSLQMLAVLNVAVGLVMGLRVRGRPWLQRAAAAGALALIVALAIDRDWGRAWDLKYFAIYRNNLRDAFDSAYTRRDALENTDVLYYFEGANETVSVIRPKGGTQAFIVNGRSEASTSFPDMQCQRTLGHAAMLLHPNPRRVFVLGTGTGMTLGATSLHPQVERIVLAEIEPGVIGAARTFAEHNEHVLDDPRLRIVFNDGRNHLATTREKFDVITADPIHPWSGGAAYLYTAEYFRSVADRLLPGGIAAQWLPLYELTAKDVQTVLRTFAGSFQHVLVWLTDTDAELIGSDSPFVIDESELARRISTPAIRRELEVLHMGSAEDFLSYFVTGSAGARAFGSGGTVNTDDNLSLEFSAPESMGLGLMDQNIAALVGHRESLEPYLVPKGDVAARAAQIDRWRRNLAAARVYDVAHTLRAGGRIDSPEFEAAMATLERESPWYAPYQFLERQLAMARAAEPRLADAVAFPVATSPAGRRTLQVSAVTMRIGESRVSVLFVDNERREIYGERYFESAPEELDATVREFVRGTLIALREAYFEVTVAARRRGEPLPAERVVAQRLRERVATRVASTGRPR